MTYSMHWANARNPLGRFAQRSDSRWHKSHKFLEKTDGREIAFSRCEMRLDDAPPLVIWEISKACDLACANCRSSAAPRRHSSELTTEEGFRLLEQIRTFGNPLMVFTGRDPLKRPDLFLLIRKSVALGLRTDVKASPTPLLTRRAIEQFKEAGVDRIAIGLDGGTLLLTMSFAAHLEASTVR
jgi:MoaA/NifB/PqqE/SkfB family radical SAM enzyme